jgi:predicted flap endonuclease-1-like 5' DNA nuclease
MEKTETSEKDIIAIVKSPAREANLRKGKGFSLAEIKAAEKDIQILRIMGIKIDYFRKSAHPVNIEALKKLKITEKKGEKRSAFVPKEKKVRDKTKKVKKKEKVIIKEKEPISEEIKVKTPPKEKVEPEIIAEEILIEKEILEPVEKVKEKSKGKIKSKKEEKGTPLTELSGLGASAEKKLKEVGVNTVEDLIAENPDELIKLISGVSQERLVRWVEEGKVLLKK